MRKIIAVARKPVDPRLEGIRLGLEAAAKWHDDRRDENDTDGM